MTWLLPLVCFILLAGPAFAQSANPQASSTSKGLKYGFGYFGLYKLSPDWAIHTDVQYRMDENLKYTFQNVYRLGLVRYLNPDLSLAGGYAQLHTYSEGFTDYFTEHRAWEQLFYFNRKTYHSYLYRFRLEQRFVEKLKFNDAGAVVTEKFNYGNRLRFYHRTTFDLTKNSEAENIFYLAVQDEVFLNIAAPELNTHFFDQNRFYTAVGIFKNQHTKLEMGYVFFFLNPSTGKNIIVHTLNFAVFQNLDFGKPE